MGQYEKISVRLAGALLLHQGELSLWEIRALPFVESDEIAAALANTLSRAFDVERYQRRAGRVISLLGGSHTFTTPNTTSQACAQRKSLGIT